MGYLKRLGRKFKRQAGKSAFTKEGRRQVVGGLASQVNAVNRIDKYRVPASALTGAVVSIASLGKLSPVSTIAAATAGGFISASALRLLRGKLTENLVRKIAERPHIALKLADKVNDNEIKVRLRALGKLPKLNLSQKHALRAVLYGNPTQAERNIYDRLMAPLQETERKTLGREKMEKNNKNKRNGNSDPFNGMRG